MCRGGGRGEVCVRTSEHVMQTSFITLLLVRDLFFIINYFEFKFLIISLRVDELLSLYNIADM